MKSGCKSIEQPAWEDKPPFQLPPARVLDAWQLPDSFTDIEGKHIWLRTTDLLGVQRTWRGDWRGNNKPADIERWNAVPTPPAYSAAQK